METTIVYQGYIGKMENGMETIFWGVGSKYSRSSVVFLGTMSGFCADFGSVIGPRKSPQCLGSRGLGFSGLGFRVKFSEMPCTIHVFAHTMTVHRDRLRSS